MLFIVGLGLGDERDITLRGLDAVQKCEKVYLEAYTSLLALGLDASATTTLRLYGRPVIVADREMVEQMAERILDEAQTSDVAFLVVGDPFGATTHSDLVVRAKSMGLKVEVIHNASVMNAVGACGLQLYRFGEAISIPFFTETWRPDSFYDKIKANRSIGLHTLCLLDIRVKEPSVEALCRGRKEYEPPRYMSVNTAVEQLLEIEENRQENVYTEETMAVGLARLGQPTQLIVAGPLKQLLSVDFGAPLHSLIITGNTHVMEEEMLNFFKQQ
ncbi:hypothetical protein Mapa_011554 [Marchantia paleacea]|nr:hypothetical protein Mapa_011554 [Marchantia paleacea]